MNKITFWFTLYDIIVDVKNQCIEFFKRIFNLFCRRFFHINRLQFQTQGHSLMLFIDQYFRGSFRYVRIWSQSLIWFCRCFNWYNHIALWISILDLMVWPSGNPGYPCLAPICYISGIIRSVIFENKSWMFFLVMFLVTPYIDRFKYLYSYERFCT